MATHLEPVNGKATKHRYTRRRILGCGLTLVAIALAMTYRRTLDIDTASGTLRHRTSAGPLVLREQIEETDFSRLAMGMGVVRGAPDWQRVNTYTLFNSVSPHHRFHSAPWDLEAFMLMCEIYRVPAAVQRTYAADLARLLAAEQMDAVRAYVECVRAVHGTP